MAITKFMQVMFSATESEDQELAKQVAEDIEAAKENGNVETEEIDYRHVGNGDVMVHDKVNNELTLAQRSEEDPDSYDLIAMPDELLEKYLHPAEDGVTPDESIASGETEDFHEHVGPEYYEQGEAKVQDLADAHEACEGEECEEKEFSVYTDNTAVQRIFSDQAFMERLFSEVIESEETAKVGDIKVEKIGEDTILVTSESTGDQAKVELDGEEMEVTELEQKEMSEVEEEEYEDEEMEDEQYEPMFVVGVDVDNHVIVDAPVYTEEDAVDLIEKLEDAGVEGLGLFECPDEAREHAEALLNELGVQNEENIAEPEQAEFSDHDIYVTRFFSDAEVEEMYMERFFSEVDPEECTDFMLKMFSETEEDAPAQESIEKALESGKEVETAEEVITPVSENEVIVEDKENGEFTKVVVNEGDMDAEKISEEEASEILGEEEKEFSVTSYMVRLFSEVEGEEMPMKGDVEKAIESKEVVETADEIITPVSENEVIVEDKENGEFTKVEVAEDGELDAKAISEEKASEIIEKKDEEAPAEDLKDEVKEDVEDKKEEEEKSFSDPIMAKFFAEVMAQTAPIAAPMAQAAPAPVPQELLQAQAAQEVAQATQDIPAVVEETPSVEAIEDKALAAVEAIHAAAQDAANMIQQAKEAPVPGAEEDLQEAQFSGEKKNEGEQKLFSETSTLSSWLGRNIR
jgi:hypothetical protein